MNQPARQPDTIERHGQWFKAAACAQLDDFEVMFPGAVDADIEAARAVCRTCPVVRHCLREIIVEEGAKHDEARHGIVAGLTGHERALVYRTLKRRGQI